MFLQCVRVGRLKSQTIYLVSLTNGSRDKLAMLGCGGWKVLHGLVKRCGGMRLVPKPGFLLCADRRQWTLEWIWSRASLTEDWFADLLPRQDSNMKLKPRI